MLTGLYPYQHGAQARKDGTKVFEYPLSPECRTLPEALKELGYRTGAVVANGGYLGKKFGFHQGFDSYDEKKPKTEPRRGPDVNALAFEWLAGIAPEERFFLFLNYMDAHRPYNVNPLPEERASKLPPPDPEIPQVLLNQLVQAVLPERKAPPPELVERVITQYDYGIANADLAIEALIAHLKELGRWDNTLFILTSDHGEFFGEHEVVEHSKDVYEPGMRVPLIVKRPGQTRGRVLEEMVSIAGIPSLVSSHMPGQAGAQLADDFPPVPGGVVFGELNYTRSKDLGKPYGKRFYRERTVIYSPPFKAILSTDGKHELFDLEQDPGELNNLREAQRRTADQLLEQAATERKRGQQAGPTGAPVVLSEDEIEAMRALGYMGDEDDGEIGPFQGRRGRNLASEAL